MRISWDEYFLNIADAVALRSSCPRLSVGAVLVKDHRIVSTGYNGAPPGAEDCLEGGCVLVEGHCKRALHGEENVLFYVSKEEAKGSILYLTHDPCINCAKVIKAYEIGAVVYRELYGNTKGGSAYLIKHRIPCFRGPQKQPLLVSPYVSI